MRRKPTIIVQISLVLVSIPLISSLPAQNARIVDPSVETVHIGVLGLFHPRQLTVNAASDSALVLRAGNECIALERGTGVDSVRIRLDPQGILLLAGAHTTRASSITASGRQGEAVDFGLSVPEKITRRYRGTLEIKPIAGDLTAIVTIDLETAVASVVAAESLPDAPLEALKAQAVAARSYFVAGRGRHHDFDFCDTTHCQFLRAPPPSGSAVARAVAATRGLVLAYDSHPFAAMYTRSCSGRTRTPAELGMTPSAYPYYSVECRYCRAHPVHWSSRISAKDAAALRDFDESARLSIDRRLGWDTVQSNEFVANTEGDQVVLQGTGLGHGIGLCQFGAKAMAEEGASFRQILSHYYPNTTVLTR